jgi:hypothetical protein
MARPPGADPLHAYVTCCPARVVVVVDGQQTGGMATLMVVVVEVDTARCVVVVARGAAVEGLVAVVLVAEWARVVAVVADLDEGWFAHAVVIKAAKATTHTKRRRRGVLSPIPTGMSRVRITRPQSPRK